MFLSKSILALTILFVGVKARYVYRDHNVIPSYLVEEANAEQDSYEDAILDHFSSVHPRPRHILESQAEDTDTAANYLHLNEDLPIFEDQSHIRLARQAQGNIDVHVPSKSIDVSGSVPLAGNDKNVLSAFGSVDGIKPGQSYGRAGIGLTVDNVNDHRLAVMGSQIPNHGDQLTAAGKLNLVHTPDHKLDANAFATRTFTTNSQLPNYNTYGGSLDYMYKNKVGATLAAQHTPVFHETGYSAMGKLNVFRTPTSSVDFRTGFSHHENPFQSFNQPQFDLIYSKSW